MISLFTARGATTVGVLALVLGTAALGVGVGATVVRSLLPMSLGRVTEVELWRSAVHAEMPVIPTGARPLPGRQMVVVSVVRQADGAVGRVAVLESTNQRLSTAVLEAVSRWRFARTSEPVSGKLTFYFDVRGADSSVTAPAREQAQAAKRSPEHQGGRVQRQGDLLVVSGWSLPKCVRLVDEAEFARRMGQPRTIALDVRSEASFKADHRPGTVNIPEPELRARGKKELANIDVVLLDCSRSASDTCPFAAMSLERFGVREIALLPHRQ